MSREDSSESLTPGSRSGPGDSERAALLRRAIRLKKAAKSTSPSRDRMGRRPADAPAYLGPLQRALWLAHQLDPSSAAYNVVSAFQVSGTLDEACLGCALNDVVAQERILRSSFREAPGRDGDVEQVVVEELEIEVERLFVGVGDLDCGDADADADGHDVADLIARATREAQRPFDLASTPLLRLLLVGREGHETEDRLLVLVAHHLLLDQHSLGLFWQRFGEAYQAAVSGESLQAPGAPRSSDVAQYDDFAYRERTRDPDEVEARQKEALSFWERKLTPSPQPVILPVERAVQGAADLPARDGWIERPVRDEVSARVEALSTEIGCTPFATYLFAFRLLLERYLAPLGQEESPHAAIGVPASARSSSATAEMLGYFLNTVPVAAAIDDGESVRRAVASFSEELRAALSHVELPIDELAARFGGPRQVDRAPLVQVMCVHRQAPVAPVFGGARLQSVELALGAAKLDLTLFVTELAAERRPDGLRPERPRVELAIEFRSDRFESVAIERLLAHYETVLERLTNDSVKTVREIELLTPFEREQLDRWQGEPLDASGLDLLPRQIRTAVLQQREKPAVVCGETRWTCGELHGAARAVLQQLREQDVGPGDRVALLAGRSAELVAGIVGIGWSGAAYVPLDPTYPPSRLELVLGDADVSAIVTTTELAKELGVDDQSGSASGQPDGQDVIPRVFLDRLPVAVVAVVEEEAASSQAASDLEADHPAYLLYTSGSAGRPKGVVVTHGGLRHSTAARGPVYGRSPGHFLLLSSVAFDSSVAGLFWTLSSGDTLIVPSDDEARDPRRLAQLIEEEQVESLLAVPSLYRAMIEASTDRDWSSLEIAIVAGEACPSALIGEHFDRVSSCRLFNEYGPTEATVWATVAELTQDDAQAVSVPIGRSIPGVSVRLHDGQGRLVPEGVPGEAWIEGPTVAEGYWRAPDATAERFESAPDPADRYPRYRTGDRMSWTADGRLIFEGRIDQQVKLRGFRVEPGEIESALLAMDDVREAGVVVRLDDPQGSNGVERLVGFVVLDQGVDPAELLQRLRGSLPAHLVPSRAVALAELPRLPNGKLDRAALRTVPIEHGADREGTSRPAAEHDTSDLERALLALWEGLLGIQGVGLDDNFFELGGHSLLVAQMALAIERDHLAAIALAEVFANPTVRELARRMEAGGGEGDRAFSHLFPIQPVGRQTPFIMAIPHELTGMLATRFRGRRPVYGLRGVGLRPEGNRGRWPTMRALAEDLVDEVCRRFPEGPFIWGGYSFGASMAMESVRLMEERGIEVERLYLVSPMALDVMRLGPIRVRLNGLRRPVSETSRGEALRLLARDNSPLGRQVYRNLSWVLLVQPWRRLLGAYAGWKMRRGEPLSDRLQYVDVRVERFRLHRSYQPKEVQAPTVVFNPIETTGDDAETWRPFFRGPLQVVPTPDPHLGPEALEAAKAVILESLEDL